MSCNCDSGQCISRGYICAPRGDDLRVVFDVYDTDGDEFDISGASEIVFIVATGSVVGGNIGPGGTILFKNTLTGGDISIAGTGYQFVVDIDGSDTADAPKVSLYYEARVTSSSGENKTVSAGIFSATDTMIKDAP